MIKNSTKSDTEVTVELSWGLQKSMQEEAYQMLFNLLVTVLAMHSLTVFRIMES